MSSSSNVSDPAIAWSGFQYLQGQPVTLDDVKRDHSILVLEQWATSALRSTTPHNSSTQRIALQHHSTKAQQCKRLTSPLSLPVIVWPACCLSWCPPCRSSIPHINSLYQQYGKHGVNVIGVTNETDEPKLRKFIQQMGAKMTYPVAVDTQDVMREYSDRYRAEGIPHAYIVDWAGRVRWQGHPMSGMGDKLDVLVNERKQHLAQLGSGAAAVGAGAAGAEAGSTAQQRGAAANALRALSGEELGGKSVKDLMAAMKAAGIDTTGCIEKSDLIDKIRGKAAV